MRLRPATILVLLAFAALVLFAHSPLLRSGFLPADYASVLGAEGALRQWAQASSALWGLPRPGASAGAWRLEALALLLLAAAASRAFSSRLLAPWIGEHSAQAAAWVAALLLPLHPAASAAIADLASRGEILGLGLGLSACALFLVGRQDEREGRTAASLLLLLAAGWASSVAPFFALILTAAEYFSVRRHRRRTLRARTAATTLAIFGSAAALPWVFRGLPIALAPDAEDLRASLQALFLELGRVAAPGSEVSGILGTLLSGALLLLALQPAFRAARNAPRLWGALVFAWSCALLLALPWSSSGPSGRELLATWVLCGALGLTLTALARPWRALGVGALAVGWAILAHLGARPWLAGSRELARLHGALVALELPADGRVLLLDPPRIQGLPSLAADLGWLTHPRLRPDAGESPFDACRVRALTREAFLAFVSTAEFQQLRAGKLIVVSREQETGLLRAMRVPPPTPETAPRSWPRSLFFEAPPDAPIDPLATECVRLVAELSTPVRELQWLGWQTFEGANGSLAGWIGVRSGRRVAEFDMASSLEWRLAGAVRRLVVEKGVNELERGELLPRAAALVELGAPAPRGGDWLFPLAPAEHAGEPGGAYALTLLALADLECVSIPLELESGLLRARDAQRFARRKGDSSLAWTVEYRSGTHVLSRTRGRIR
ncbi:MAG: hypothetical protein EXS08_07660 [Planctomycetes bacterium]|nr:hypothetical protein [Planctomycetota bacterium]